MLSSPVCDLAPELQTSEIPEAFMKHPVQKSVLYYDNRNGAKSSDFITLITRREGLQCLYHITLLFRK
jgi:hypothetical protein